MPDTAALHADLHADPHPALTGGSRPVAPDPPVWPERGEEEARLLQEVLRDGRWSTPAGPRTTRFEHRFAELQALPSPSHVRCVTSGTVALQLACEALGLGPGDEVVVPGLAEQGTAGAVLDANAVPVLVDVSPDTWCLDPAAVTAAITDRTRAVIAVHLYGTMPDLTELTALAAQNGLALIEDCAHAHGARWEEHGAGAFGTMSVFSFGASRTLTAGEGGCVVTSDAVLADQLSSLRDSGRPPSDVPPPFWRPVQSGNHRMTEWQAAVLLAQCDRFEEQRDRRERVVAAWREAAERSGFLRPARVLPGVRRPPGYAFAASYDERALNGVPVETFRAALAAELSAPVEPCYRPLGDSPFYRPRTKRKHWLSAAYWNAIDPARSDLPNCATLHRTSVVVPHAATLRPGAEEHLPQALEKIARGADRLRRWRSDPWSSHSHL
ncbi:aminotransferase class I/II-fold pyridoxal phosphate-dependent enzyme [Streptomyces sp. AV19]|uniref:DegT/DnrJ/EryC1/StrS family aminotransferase n=1 Tax=Streptomyces sp. AV19 TaxID=2793068 RepID=UPI0018FE5B93|nr:aminotransferase class I/II-fold pyridoxal phosphate-dependent enzyme [Streptomyces sp. AV19]MBH1934419.1 aminotransferase class I/II-fold pyridoxal phosphate-dependent enzyme [Streptomyces sp. AV19]MDG4533209.1 aminotransferase class I/II-fold pyridoxal phosphate-dependent enzyme [Streptomyces sp. AV19]